MPSERLDRSKSYHFFYRDSYRKVVKALLVAVSIALLLFFTIIYFLVSSPERQYYATSAVGDLFVVHPVAPPANQKQK